MFLSLNSQQQHALDAATQAFGPMLEGLVKYSIPITIVTFILGLIIALFTALMRISSSKVLRGIARVYVSIIRGTPMIVQLFIIFYGIPNLTSNYWKCRRTMDIVFCCFSDYWIVFKCGCICI